MTEAVVGSFLLLVLQRFIGLVHLLELGLCIRIVGVAVGMKFLGLLAIGLLDFLGRGALFDAQNLVEIPLCH